jgi:Post-segregation antitoxin CcdA
MTHLKAYVRTFDEAKEYVQCLGLRNQLDWREWCKSGRKPTDIPSDPSRIYKNEWIAWGDWLGTGDIKQKLTLTINQNVIKKAKNAGLNISSLTERVLNAYSYASDGNSKEDVIRSYENLFDIIKEIVKIYGISVDVGISTSDTESNSRILLNADNGLYIKNENSCVIKTTVAQILQHLYSPDVILEQLILACLASAAQNKTKTTELNIALRFLKLLFADDLK